MKLSAIIKSSICVLSLVGASNFLAVRANAGQAAARAAVTVTNASTFTESVSGEVLLPDGLYFGGVTSPSTATLLVTPVVATDATTGIKTITTLSFDAGTPAAVPAATTSTISDVVATILKGSNLGVKATTIDDAAAIIKAAAGVNGLE